MWGNNMMNGNNWPMMSGYRQMNYMNGHEGHRYQSYGKRSAEAEAEAEPKAEAEADADADADAFHGDMMFGNNWPMMNNWMYGNNMNYMNRPYHQYSSYRYHF